MRNPRENIASALRALCENWLRSALTMLGIVIGVASIVLVVAVGQGVKADVSKQIESLGANVVFVFPGKLERNGQPNPMSALGISTLTEKDLADLVTVPGVQFAAPIMFVFGSIEHAGEAHNALVFASTHGIHDIRPRPFTEGRFFTDGELDEEVCVLASTPKKKIFGEKPALGETVLVRDVPFRVVGVFEEEEESIFGQGGTSNVVFVPVQAAKRLFHGGQINRLVLALDYTRPSEDTLKAIRETFLHNHAGKEDFGVVTQKQLLSTVFRVFNLVTAFLVCISAISLVVAGIGIMNIMLVTVTERTREIGVRKSVGARRRDVLSQFLTESILLSLAGGAIGTLLAALISVIVAYSTPLKPLLTIRAVALATLVCLAVGVVFGVAPAIRAARKDPIEALHWE